MSETDLTVNVGMELKARDGTVFRNQKDIENIKFCPACMNKAIEARDSGDPITVRSTVVNLLDSISVTKNKDPLDGMEKQRRSDLAEKIYKAEGLVDLSKSDRNLIKQLIGDNCSPLFVGQIFPIIDPSGSVKN